MTLQSENSIRNQFALFYTGLFGSAFSRNGGLVFNCRMLKNEPLRVPACPRRTSEASRKGTAKRNSRSLLALNPQELGALRGLCGLSLSIGLKDQQPASDIAVSKSTEKVGLWVEETPAESPGSAA